MLMICSCILTVEYSLQLVDGSSSGDHGYLEILDQGGVWRRICSDSWNQDNAMVACRQLGYQQLVNTSYGGHYTVVILLHAIKLSFFISAGIAAQSTSSVVVASTDCTGDEFHLQSCISFQFQHNNLCTSGQNVMLTCVGK